MVSSDIVKHPVSTQKWEHVLPYDGLEIEQYDRGEITAVQY